MSAPAGDGGWPRTGIGLDSHAFAPDRPLVLGGVVVPHSHGLAGHSDADVLLHAIADAILGAAGLEDIGAHFPDADPAYAGADSMVLLGRALEAVRAVGLRCAQVDATVMMERPRLAPHRAAIRARVAAGLGLAEGQVNVKATTGEGMGFVGRGEGVAALAVATLVPV